MATGLIIGFCLLMSVITCDGFHVLGPSGPLTVQLGDSVLLPCSVETPLPMEELEVEWRRNDSGALVHLWQDRESRPESQDQRYHERAHFFTEEIEHGNFSLLLTNVTQEDAGVYKCVIYTNLESDETLIEINEIERLIVSGAHVISAYAGEDITLNCSVDSHITPENMEEISWKKIDEDILVLLYQKGEVLTDSSHNRYRDRAEFFIAEERNKGNFSMRLKDVQTEDKGLYICEAFSGKLSHNTSVEVQQLDDSRRALAILCAHVLCPNITMSIVFILWGITDAIIVDVWYKADTGQKVMLVFLPLEPFLNLMYVIDIAVILYVWIKADITAGKVVILFLLLLGPCLNFLYVMANVCCKRILQKQTEMTYVTTENSNCLRICAIILTYGLSLLRDTLTCATAFLYILTVMILFASLKKLSESDDNNITTQSRSDSINSGTQPRLSHVAVFILGSVVVVFVNAVTLFVELILKARNGHHTVDLPLILIPTECVFAVCCMALQISDFWKKNRNRFREDMNRLRRVCMCKQPPQESKPIDCGKHYESDYKLFSQ
ncbi:butyrophilin-like protein 2, partial [Clarias magur]